MIVSVVGNFLCIVNICFCLIFFEIFAQRQQTCLDNYYSTDKLLHMCIICWLKKNKAFYVGMDINGSMILCFSEIMALFPYFLRSLRIKKMFDFREIYWQTNRMPKELIRKWRESRVMTIFLACLFGFGITYIILDRLFNIFPNYNSMGTYIEQWFPFMHYYNDSVGMVSMYSMDQTLICMVSFFEYMLLLWALYNQMNVESDYSIFREILLISITWIVCNTAINFVWILNGTLMTKGRYLTISHLRWYNFGFITFRSTICILVSTCKNVRDTFVMDQMVLRPPDENALDDLEMILHNTSALEYFYDFLKEQDDRDRDFMHYQVGGGGPVGMS